MHFHIFNIASWVLPSRCHFTRRFLLRTAGADVGNDVCLSADVRVYGAKSVVIEDATWLSPECRLFASGGAKIQIRARCDIGHGTWFVTGTHEIGASSRRAAVGLSKDIVIGSGTWIGARATILGGAEIGPGSIVAAGAVVIAGIYPPDSLLAGVPAVIKRKLS
jgi:maltose O-acetyltransferase